MEYIDTNYIYPKNEDIDIIVGDEKQEDFKPRMKIKRWDNEVNFSVGIISTHAGSDGESNDKVEWNDGHGVKARFYQKPEDEFEFEIELESEPENRIIELSIETKGLDFFYQPFEVEEGDEIPENVKGSYAVYHKEKSGGKYYVGKAFHIYRPFVIDAEKKQVWCELDITDNIMSITVPTELMYPIVIDPTFGCNPATPGGSWYAGINANAVRGTPYTSPSDIDTAQSISCYTRKGSLSNAYYFKGMMVLASTKNIISNGIGDPVYTSSTSGSWKASSFSTDPTLTGSTGYILMIVVSNTPSLAYDVVTNGSRKDDSNSYASPQNPTDMSNTSRKYSVYSTYTESTAMPVIIHHLQQQGIL